MNEDLTLAEVLTALGIIGGSFATIAFIIWCVR